MRMLAERTCAEGGNLAGAAIRWATPGGSCRCIAVGEASWEGDSSAPLNSCCWPGAG